MNKWRSQNGTGDTPSFTVSFDVNDPAEARALRTAKRLATPHGRRKELFVMFLNAIADYEEQTGRQAFAETISGSLVAAALMGQSLRPTNTNLTPPPEVAAVDIAMTSGGKASAEEQANKFASKFASRFGKR